MSAVKLEVSQQIAAPAARVWAVVANYARDRDWRRGVEIRQEPPGMAVAGALTYERLRLFGSDKQVVARLEEVEPGHRLTFRTIEGDVAVRGERRVEARGDGESCVTVRLEMEPTGLWSLLQKPLVALFRRRFAQDLERLAKLVEEGDLGILPDIRRPRGASP